MSRKKAVFLYESKRMRWFALAGIIAGVLFTILMMHEFKGAFEDGSFYLGGGINFGFCKMLGSASILIVGCIAVMSIFNFRIGIKEYTGVPAEPAIYSKRTFPCKSVVWVWYNFIVWNYCFTRNDLCKKLLYYRILEKPVRDCL